MSDAVRTWHHGLVARWWAEFNQGGDDVDVFVDAVEASGGPVLDAGCGTGRLLLPLARAGFEVDGSDAAPDMLDWCARRLADEGLSAGLFPLAMHEIDLPRRYRTVLVCGAFGLGAGREADLEGLKRLHRHLLPGGLLLMDHYLPNLEHPRGWMSWVEAPDLPRPWPSRGDRRRAADGTELELRTRQLAFDPLEQTTTLEIRAIHYVDGSEAAVETSAIHIDLYFKREIELMLRVAGFRGISVLAFGEARAPLPWQDRRILFRALA